MTLSEQLEQMEKRMEECVSHNRFDTFDQLASERLVLLKKAACSPEKNALLARANEQTERWVQMLDQRVGTMRLKKTQTQALSGYLKSSRSGRLLNRSF